MMIKLNRWGRVRGQGIFVRSLMFEIILFLKTKERTFLTYLCCSMQRRAISFLSNSHSFTLKIQLNQSQNATISRPLFRRHSSSLNIVFVVRIISHEHRCCLCCALAHKCSATLPVLIGLKTIIIFVFSLN